MKKKTRNPYTFRHECDSCGAKPVLRATGMCAVCTYGEADSYWDWVNEYWAGGQLKLVKQYIHSLYNEMKGSGIALAPELHNRLQAIMRSPKEKK